jgi:hypothetical protein
MCIFRWPVVNYTDALKLIPGIMLPENHLKLGPLCTSNHIFCQLSSALPQESSTINRFRRSNQVKTDALGLQRPENIK